MASSESRLKEIGLKKLVERILLDKGQQKDRVDKFDKGAMPEYSSLKNVEASKNERLLYKFIINLYTYKYQRLLK